MKILVSVAVFVALALPVNAQSRIPLTFAEEGQTDYGQGYRQASPTIPRTECLQGRFKPSWGIVQVSARKTDGTDLSTGCAVGNCADGRRIFLTTNHSVAGASLIGVHTRGMNSKAEVLATDARHDVALIAAQVPTGHPMRNWTVAQIDGDDPDDTYEEDEATPFGGYSPETDQYRQVEPMITNLGEDRFYAKVYLRQGMSGGPVYDRETKHLKGMIVAVGKKKPWALAVNSQWLTAFMARNLDKVALKTVRISGPVKSISWSKLNSTRIDNSQWVPVSYRVRGRVQLINWR